MDATSHPKLLFVINPFAGSHGKPDCQDIIGKYFTEKKQRVVYFVLPAEPDAAALKKYVLEEQPDIAVAVGGDGTVSLLANIVAGTEIALGILPTGSANGMARELGIPPVPTDALAVIEAGLQKRCDTIKINNKNTCLHLSDIGINAQLIKYFGEGKLRGKLGYARLILKTLIHKEKMQAIIQSRGLELRRNAFMVILANATMYGTGAVINPRGQLDDGIFEVIVVRKLSFFSILKTVLNPGQFNPKHIETFPSTAVEIQTLRKVHFQIDGEYMGKTAHILAKVEPANIQLILPLHKEGAL